MDYKYPAAIVFDLDYTLWPCWCDTHISPPLRAIDDLTVLDRNKYKLRLFKDVPNILSNLKKRKVIIIGASRTATPDVALELLSMFKIDGKPMLEFFDNLQWGQGSKVNHITRAALELDLTEELKDGNFILFDDEGRNRDVLNINCNFVLVNESVGLSQSLFKKEIVAWRSKCSN